MIRRRTMLASSLAVLGLSACGSDGGEKKAGRASSAGPASDAGGGDALSRVTVKGDVGSAPKIEFATPLKISKPESRMLVEGTGEKVSEGDCIALNTVYMDAESGKVLQSYWDGAPANYLAVKAGPNGAQTAEFLSTARVGSRFAMAGQIETRQGLIGVVQVSDVVSIALKRAEGKSIPIPADQPQFTLGADGAPTLTSRPSETPPASTVATVTIEGTGEVTAAGDTLAMQYTGWKLSDGQEFDSSWKRGEPFSFTLGKGQVITGWDTGLLGKKVGSQVLLVIPPEQAYGPAPAAGSAGGQNPLAGQTLIFVADILGAAKPASR